MSELIPGDKVVILMTAYSHEMSVWYDTDVVDATEGSIGRVLSYGEYREIYKNTPEMILRDHFVRDDPEYVDYGRKKGMHCAIMFETVEPSKTKAHAVRCAVGKVLVLDNRFFQQPNQDKSDVITSLIGRLRKKDGNLELIAFCPILFWG
jgi:hypothetical protein